MNIKVPVVLLLIIALTACVTVYEPMPTKVSRTYSAVVSHSDIFQPTPGQSFSWFTDGIVTSDGESDIQVPQHVQILLAETLEAALIDKGFRIASSPSSADFLIGAGVLSNDNEQTQAMLDFIRVFPAIRETLDENQPVSLLVTAGRPGNITQHHLMWRGAVNAAATVEDMADAERQTMIRELVATLLEQFP